MVVGRKVDMIVELGRGEVGRTVVLGLDCKGIVEHLDMKGFGYWGSVVVVVGRELDMMD